LKSKHKKPRNNCGALDLIVCGESKALWDAQTTGCFGVLIIYIQSFCVQIAPRAFVVRGKLVSADFADPAFFVFDRFGFCDVYSCHFLLSIFKPAPI